MAILYTEVLFLLVYIYMYSLLSDQGRGSWNETLGGVLSHTNTEVRLDLPLLILGPLPLLVLVGSEPLGDLFALLVSPSGPWPGLFGERDGCPASVATETEFCQFVP